MDLYLKLAGAAAAVVAASAFLAAASLFLADAASASAPRDGQCSHAHSSYGVAIHAMTPPRR